MEFLPHVLLHALLEGNSDAVEKVYIEISSVVSVFDGEFKTPDKIFSVCSSYYKINL